MGEIDHVGRGLAPAAKSAFDLCGAGRRGRRPLRMRNYSTPYMVRNLQTFLTVGDGALDVP